MREHLKHFIGGQWVESDGGSRYDVINPATETACAVITMGTAADVDKAVAAARAAFPAFAATSVDDRMALLDRITQAYMARMPEIAASISDEMGAPIGFANAAQAPAGLGHFMTARKALEEFSFSEEVGGALVVHEAIGVVGMITPWNWPINQIAAKVAACIAAGNTMVLKPSEECPTNAVILTEVMQEAGVPAGVFNLVLGDGPVVGNAIAKHADIDMVSFTGSTRAGIMVAEAAAPTVKRVHQELGGKAPNLVLEGADLAAMLPATVGGVMANSGQSCIAPTRVLAPKADKANVDAAVTSIVRATTVGNPAEMGTHIGPLVNKAQFEKVQELIQSAIDEGATLLCGGPGLPDGMNQGYYVRPTALTDVTPDMRIYREETFGPVVTISTYDSIDQGVEMANDTEYGLSATVTGPADAAKQVVGKLRAGLVTVNGWSGGQMTPFGGYKKSGNGREFGKYGIAEFMEYKTITGI